MTDELYAITPFQSGGQTGWFAAVQRHGVSYRKTFTAYRYGNSGNALSAAIKWRNELVQSVAPLSLAEYANLLRHNNTSGYPGVYLMQRTRRDPSGQVHVHAHWEARSPAGLHPAKKRGFSIKKFGNERAFELAVEARNQFVSQLDGYLQRRVPEHLRIRP
jgi:hypothetical protein